MSLRSDPASPAYALVLHAWEHREEAISKADKSGRRLSTGLYTAVLAAIECGLFFAEGDFKAFYAEMTFQDKRRSPRQTHAALPDGDEGEHLYARAVQRGNLSACLSFESWKRRPPFIYGGSRLHCLASFDWKDTPNVVVTSFCPSGQSVTLRAGVPPQATCASTPQFFAVSIAEIREAERERVDEVRLATFLDGLARRDVYIAPAAARKWSLFERGRAEVWAADRSTPPPPHVAAALKGAA